VVAAHLLVRGHYVAPAGPPRSGAWPLTVDGRSVRVVCAPDAAALAERLAATGDVPVLVNAELAGTLPRALFARVCFVEGFSRARVMRIVEALHSALQPVAHGPRAGMASAAADADADADANASVPLFALAVAWARAPHDAGDARLSGMQAIELALLEGGLRSGLAVLGGFAGAGLGQLVFGPAAGSLFAERLPQWLGLLADEAGRAFDDLEGGPRDQAWAEDAARALDDLVARVHEALDARFACMKSAYDAIPAGPLHDALCAGIEEDNRSLREFRRRLEHAAAAAPTDPSAPSDPSDPSDPSAPSDPSGSSPPAGRPHSIPAVAHRIVAVLRLIADGTVHPVFHGAALGRLAVLLEQRTGASARRSGAVDDGLSDAVRGAVHDVLGRWLRAGLRTRF